MDRSRREIAFVKRLAKYLAFRLGTKLVWNWPERWSEWKEIGRTTVAEGTATVTFPKEYLEDGQLKLKLVTRRLASPPASMTISFNAE